jgi:uracil-DNA glycosylase family 4
MQNKSELSMTQSSFLKSLRTVVNYQRNCGIKSYAASDSLHHTMTVLDNLASQTRVENDPQQQAAIPAPITGGREEPAAGQGQSIAVSTKMTDLSAQVAVCNHCSLHRNRFIDTSGNGGEKPSLLIIGDWLEVQEGKSPGASEIFGSEEDLMLAKMIAAIELGKDDVFVTNIIKCSVPASERPTAEHIATCSSYLKQQISALSPRIICAMGTAAAQLLIGTSQALSQLRGRFHPCRLPSADTTPVMATYHPTYLLKNPEMKQAVWSDLQAIQRELTKR